MFFIIFCHEQVGRIVTGTGNGIITSTVPVWHSELCKAESRGKFVTVELSTNVVSVFTCLHVHGRDSIPKGGVAVAYWVDYGMSYVDSSAQWRFPIALQILFALTTISLICFLPETPRWLLSHDRDREAGEILLRLHTGQDPALIEKERLEIIAAIVEEREAQEALGGKRCVLFLRTKEIPVLIQAINTAPWPPSSPMENSVSFTELRSALPQW